VSHLTYQYTLFFSISRRPPNSTLFPYTTLFRSIWMQYNAHILQDCPFVALQLSQLVHTDHKSGYRRVERKTLDIVFDLFDDLMRSEEHTSELQSRENLVCRLLLEKKKKNTEINK